MTHTEPILLSPAQHGLWFTERAGFAGTAYHLALTVTLRGTVDADVLAKSTADVLGAHPQLAGACVEADGVVRLVPGAGLVPVERFDGAGEAEREVVDRVVRQQFDLAVGPLCRAAVIRTAADRATLVFVAHHVCFDGQSKEGFVAELTSRYAQNAVTSPGPVPLQHDGYGEAVAAVRSRAAADLPAARVRFAGWRPPHHVELPRDGGATEPDRAVPVPLPAGFSESLDRAADLLEATRFEVLTAALLGLLSRYGNPTPTVGVDVSTRPSGAEAALGMFVNELPLAVQIDPGTSFRAVVAAVRTALRELYAHRYAPLAEAAGGLPPGRSVAPVSVSYRRRRSDVSVPGVEVDVDWSVFPGTARGDLHLHAVDGPAGLFLQVQPATRSGVDGAAVARHLATLIPSALAGPDTPLRALALLDDTERAAIAASQGLPVTRPPLTVVDLIARQVTRAPHAPALVMAGTTMSYAELADRAGRVATRLRDAGVEPGALVAVCAAPAPAHVAALLGVLLTGARYLPLDLENPADRLAYLLSDSEAAAVLADAAGARRLAGHAVPILPLDAAGRSTVFTGAAGPDDPAYVMYTSGSTGRPKGVVVGHRALVNLLLDMRDRLGSGPDAVWLALTSPSFDISLLELLLPLISGARLVVAPTGARRDGVQVRELIERHGITHVQATPSGWQVLLAAGLDEPRLTALAGGEALPVPLAADLRSRVGRLWNAYGPTETTVWSTAWPVPIGPDTVRIGAPLSNTSAHVLDQDGTVVPVGVSGELYLSGTGLADGYLRRPELTADRFTVHDGVRCYRTGDRVRWRADGTLEYLGRFDQQIKLRGHRIEPGEVEAAIATHPGVGGVAVGLAGAELVAYLTPTAGAPVPSPGELRGHLASVLPAALHPGRYVVLEAFPLTPNGKLDRAALPTPDAVLESPVSDGPVSDGPVERILCEVLGRPRIAPDDDLFDLGVHSLMITKIAARFRERLGVDLPLADFFDAVTVADLVAAAGTPR